MPGFALVRAGAPDIDATAAFAPTTCEEQLARMTTDEINVFWHRELPPLSAEPVSEHVLEAASKRVKGDLAHRNQLWDECYDDLMAAAGTRLRQEVSRLGGHYAHVMEEFIDSRHDDATGEAWLQGRFSYMLLKRSMG